MLFDLYYSFSAELRHQKLLKEHENLRHELKRKHEDKASLEEKLEQARKLAKRHKKGKKGSGGGEDEPLNEKLCVAFLFDCPLVFSRLCFMLLLTGLSCRVQGRDDEVLHTHGLV
jgi:hypothetical protein